MSKLDTHKVQIAGEIAAGFSQRRLATEYGVARSTMQEFCKKHGLVTQHAGNGDLIVGDVTEVEKLKAELTDLKKVKRLERKLDVQAERVLDEIRSAFTATDARFEPPKCHDHEDRKHKHHPHSQAILLSDIHAGEVVTSESVDGMNEYNWEIAERRTWSILDKLASYRSTWTFDVDEFHVWLLGDMCSGSNHLELLETNEFSAADQGVRVGLLLGQWIEQLVPHYERIVVHGVPGNHPRVPAKPQSKQVFNNFDWVAYKIAETYLGNYESIECHFPRSGMHVAEIAGTKQLLSHGDGIRSTMAGVPWGGVMKRWSELRKQYLQRGIVLDGWAVGHYHNPHAMPQILMNGSVKGVDEYSVKNFGSGEAPEQLLATFDPRKKRRTVVASINPE